MSHKILVVDDEPDIREIIREFLEEEGYEVLEAGNGDEAIELAHSAKPTLITLDVMMPGRDGIEVCELLKQDPETEHIPIIILSVFADKTEVIDGIADRLSKPFERDNLIQSVRNALASPRPGSQTPTRVLVVDDDPGIVDLITTWLEEFDFVTEKAGDGAEGLDKMLSFKPDIVILDIKMPRVNGFEVIKRMKSDHRTSDVPIILLSSMTGEENVQLGLRLGATKFLPKPFEPEALLTHIRAVLGHALGEAGE
ncbi:MAG: response regulator [Candidatus Omnitrophica bacterium]|nr:response regulator [Candidatus Omnitrophota bacterium]